MKTNVDFAFLHGGGQGGWVWCEVIEALNRQTSRTFARAMVLDVPGCGRKRARDTQNLCFDDVIDELLTELEDASFKDIVLIGHSQAGTLLPRLAEKLPGLFRRLVYVSCVAPLPGQNILQMMGSSQSGTNEHEVGFPLDPKFHALQAQYPLMFCNDMDEDDADCFLSELGHDTWPASTTLASDWRYSHLTSIPSSYIVCLRDGLLPVSWQNIFARRLHAERVLHVDAGHQVMNTRPHALAEMLRREAVQDSNRRT